MQKNETKIKSKIKSKIYFVFHFLILPLRIFLILLKKNQFLNMKITFLFILLNFIFSILSAQNDDNEKKATIYGNPKDPKVIKQAEELESRGFKVEISEKRPNPLLNGKDKRMQKRYENKPLPAFQFKDINGKKINSQDLKGKFVHVYFWDIGNETSIEKFEELNKLKEKYEEKNMVFLAFVSDKKEKLNKILNKNKFQYTIIPDASKYFKELGIRTSEVVSFFVDEQGIVKTVVDNINMILDPKTFKPTQNNYIFYVEIIDNLMKK